MSYFPKIPTIVRACLKLKHLDALRAFARAHARARVMALLKFRAKAKRAQLMKAVLIDKPFG